MGTDAVDVVGAGGIGCAVGYELADAGRAVRFVEVDAEKIDRGNRTKRPNTSFVNFDDWRPAPERVVLLCTKCYDNAAVLDRLPAGTPLVPIQNGYDDRLDSFGHAAEGIASFVAHCPRGSVEPTITRRGGLHLGRRSAATQELSYVARLHETLRSSKRFRYRPVSDVGPLKATKLMYNAAISPIAAAAGIDNGELLSDPIARRLFFALIQENYAILTAAGYELGTVGPFHPRTVARILRRPWLARAFAKCFEPSLRGTYCSMAGEIETGRTEIDNYTGHLLRLAGTTAPCPINRAVYDVVKRMVQERAVPRRDVLLSL